jgi:hypothetical protein
MNNPNPTLTKVQEFLSNANYYEAFSALMEYKEKYTFPLNLMPIFEQLKQEFYQPILPIHFNLRLKVLVKDLASQTIYHSYHRGRRV